MSVHKCIYFPVATLKGVGAVGIVCFFILASFPVLPFYRAYRYQALRYLNCLVSLCSKMMLKVLGIEVNYGKLCHKKLEKGTLFVGNHLSYIDIFILSARFPFCFITSNDMGNTPVLGTICKLAGCLFVERKAPTEQHRKKSQKEIREALRHNTDVILFPEATSSNGEGVLPFKKSFFYPAFEQHRPIGHFLLQYTHIDGRPITIETRDRVFWYGEMSFAPHFIGLLFHRSVTVELKLVDVIQSQDYDNVSEMVRDIYKRTCELYCPIA